MDKKLLNEISRVKSIINHGLIIENISSIINKLIFNGVRADINPLLTNLLRNIKNNSELNNFLKDSSNIKSLKDNIIDLIKMDSKKYNLSNAEKISLVSLSDDELKQLLGNDLKDYIKIIKPDLKSSTVDNIKAAISNGAGRLTDKLKRDWVKMAILTKDGKGGYKVSKVKVVAWAAAIGYTYYKLKNWFEGEGIPVEDDSTPVEPTPTIKPKFTEKSDFPFKKGDMSEKIKEVQVCLGLTADGKFGNATEQILLSLGVGNTITKELYDEIIKVCKEKRGTISSGTPQTLTPSQETGVEVSRTYGDEF